MCGARARRERTMIPPAGRARGALIYKIVCAAVIAEVTAPGTFSVCKSSGREGGGDGPGRPASEECVPVGRMRLPSSSRYGASGRQPRGWMIASELGAGRRRATRIALLLFFASFATSPLSRPPSPRENSVRCDGSRNAELLKSQRDTRESVSPLSFDLSESVSDLYGTTTPRNRNLICC